VRLVLDTNTVVSALLWQGKPHALLFDAVPHHGAALFASPWLFAELLERNGGFTDEDGGNEPRRSAESEMFQIDTRTGAPRA